MQNAAEVASQIIRPARSAAIQSPFGTRTPEVVPFQANTTSLSQFTWERSGNWPYGASSTRAFGSFSCFTTSVAHWPEKLSKESTSTPRAPSMDHIAISTAPVSDAGTMATRQSAGRPRRARERSITSARRALGAAAR